VYRSAALVTTPAYWQDEPGRQSMRLNFEMRDRGTLNIERTVIIADQFWPTTPISLPERGVKILDSRPQLDRPLPCVFFCQVFQWGVVMVSAPATPPRRTTSQSHHGQPRPRENQTQNQTPARH